MRQTHILCTVTNDLTYDRRMDRICRALVAGGYRVTLVGRMLPGSAPFDPHAFAGKRIRCWFHRGFLFYAEYNLRLLGYLLFHAFDVVCACDLDTALPVSVAGRLKRKPAVLDAHEYFTEAPEIAHRPRVKRIWEWIGYQTVPRFRARYTVGEHLASLMKDKYKVPFEVIRNIAPTDKNGDSGIDLLRRENIIVYQGAINVGRGLEVLVEAMVSLPGWKLWLAGEGDITSSLKARVKALGVQDRVTFLGWVKPENLTALMAKAKLAVNLRDASSLNDYYSLPNKFFDAIHAGLPAIQMDYPEYRAVQLRYSCSILLPKLSVDAVIDAVKSIEKDTGLLEALGKGCRQAALEFTWEKEAEKLLRFYHAIKPARSE